MRDYRNNTDCFVDLCHEMKTPLSVIMGAAKLIEIETVRCSGSPGIRKNLQKIEQNCYRLLRMLNNMMDMARIESQNLELSTVNCNVSTLVEQITGSVSPYAEEKGVELTFCCTRKTINAEADINKLERILLNLLSNAIKFTLPGGRVEVCVYTENGNVKISVRDTGPGIPEEMKEKIFKRFSQIKSSHSFKGSGIGLSLVKSLVELHGGRVDVESSENRGSIFTVVLPLLQEKEQRDPTEHVQTAPEQVADAVNVEFSDINLSSTTS